MWARGGCSIALFFILFLALDPAAATGDSHRRGIRVDIQELERIIQGAGKKKTILDNVSATIMPGEMVALMGPSGAGKTVLLETIMGDQPPTRGQVLLDGKGFADPAIRFIRHRVGYVPQEDVMHRDLSVYEVLYYTAKLRMAKTKTEAEIKERIEGLCGLMGLEEHMKKIVGGDGVVRGISGGQRKRVNVLMELLHKPELLFLDEPTSGLDSVTSMEMITYLKTLSQEEDTTIVMTIHQPRMEIFNTMDMLCLMGKGGKLIYYGPALGATSYLNQFPSALSLTPTNMSSPTPAFINPADYVLDVLGDEQTSTNEWKERFRKSQTCSVFVTDRGRGEKHLLGKGMRNAAKATGNLKGSRKREGFAQFPILFARYNARKMKNPRSTAGSLIASVILGILFGTSLKDEDGELLSAMFQTSLAVCFISLNSASRELIQDRPNFLRSLRSGMSPHIYILSVYVWQSIFNALCAVILVYTFQAVGKYRTVDSHIVRMMSTLSLLAVNMVAVGLFLSACVSSEIAAVTISPYLVIPQMVFSGYGALRYHAMSPGFKLFADMLPARYSLDELSREFTEGDNPRWSKQFVNASLGYPIYKGSLLSPHPNIKLLYSGIVFLGATLLKVVATDTDTFRKYPGNAYEWKDGDGCDAGLQSDPGMTEATWMNQWTPSSQPSPGSDTWKRYVDINTGNPYFHNPVTKETQWNDPDDLARVSTDDELGDGVDAD